MSKLLGLSKSIQLLFEEYPFLKEEYPTLVTTLSRTASSPDDDDNPNPIHDLIDASSLNNKIKSALKDLTTEPIKETAKNVISYLETYYKNDQLFMRSSTKGKPSAIPVDQVHRDGIALYTIQKKKWNMSDKDLGATYTSYLNRAVNIVENDEVEEPNSLEPNTGTGHKLKITNATFQKWVEEKFKDDKSIFSKTGQLRYLFNKYPILTKVSIEPFSISIGLSKPYLSQKPFDNALILQEIRQTSTWTPGKSFKSSITAWSGSYTFDWFSWFSPTVKLDLLKLAQTAAKKTDDPKTPLGKIELAAVVVQQNLNDETFQTMGKELGYPNMFEGTVDKATVVSLKIGFTFDCFRYVAKKVKDQGERKVLRKLQGMSEEALKKADKVASTIDGKKSRNVIKVATKELKETVTGKMKNVLLKELKTDAAKEVGKKIIKRTGTAIMTKLAKGAATRLVLKAIPVVNIISTIWDVFWLCDSLFNYFSTPPPPTPEQVARMEQRRAWDNISSRIRDEANKNPLNRRYVVLRAFNYLAKEGAGMYGYSANIRSEVHLKFYETSATGGYYFNPKGDGKTEYADYVISEGEEKVGEGVKIAHEIHWEKEIMDASAVLKFLTNGGENPKYTPRYEAMPLKGDDKAELMVMSDYWVLKERMELKDKYYKKPDKIN
ncbi:MAG: hypothetical protein MK212_08290 [Saprospiraceae bacterium]|nr:hypothetical protein [Saprospiraceae bacterium]